MKVRTQLIVAFLTLAILPLAGIVFYSYLSSQESFRRAVEGEGRTLAKEMGGRLAETRQDLQSRLASVAHLPMSALLPSGTGGDEASEVYIDLMAQMGEVVELVEWLEFSTLDESGGGFFIYPSKVLAEALGKLKRRELTLEQSGISREYLEETIRQAVFQRRRLKETEIEAVEARGQEMRELLGSELTAPVLRGDQTVGYLTALVPPQQLLQQVLSRTPRDGGELPYARDAQGTLYADSRRDRAQLEEIGLPVEGDAATAQRDDWMVVETPDPESGLVFGVALPMRESLQDFRRTAINNFGFGLAMVVVALAGVLWISGRMTRKLRMLTVGADRLAGGDLMTRVPVQSRDELGQLAAAFNRMARELSQNQRRLVQEESLRNQQEMQQRLLEAENQRKSRELEEARALQLSLLPPSLPSHPELEVAVFMRTATEVGGDYYDFFEGDDGVLTAAIGDATGHGARAGTMVTMVKGLFTAAAAHGDLVEILEEATRAIKRMQLGRMNMAASLIRTDGRRIRIAAAGMPPVLLYRRAAGRVEEVELTGTPLGSLADATYRDWRSHLELGDTVLLMSDGFPELLDDRGEPVGYERARAIFEACAAREPQEIIDRMAAAAEEWHGGRPPDDDVTFVVLRRRER